MAPLSGVGHGSCSSITRFALCRIEGEKSVSAENDVHREPLDVAEMKRGASCRVQRASTGRRWTAGGRHPAVTPTGSSRCCGAASAPAARQRPPGGRRRSPGLSTEAAPGGGGGPVANLRCPTSSSSAAAGRARRPGPFPAAEQVRVSRHRSGGRVGRPGRWLVGGPCPGDTWALSKLPRKFQQEGGKERSLCVSKGETDESQGLARETSVVKSE